MTVKSVHKTGSTVNPPPQHDLQFIHSPHISFVAPIKPLAAL